MEDNMSGVANRNREGCWGSFPSRDPPTKISFCYWMLWEMGFIPTLCFGCRKGFSPVALGGGASLCSADASGLSNPKFTPSEAAPKARQPHEGAHGEVWGCAGL